MEIRHVSRQDSLAVSLTTTITDLPDVIGDTYGQIMDYMERRVIRPSGFPYVIYRNMDEKALDVEIGIPVAARPEGEQEIHASFLPSGRILYALHTGPYRTLEVTYQQVMNYAEQEGLKLKDWMYELYLNSPTVTPEEKLQTGICFPLA